MTEPNVTEVDEKEEPMHVMGLLEDFQSKVQLVSIIPKEGIQMIRTIDAKITKNAITLKNMIELTTSETENSEPILLTEIPVDTLDIIIKYLTFHWTDNEFEQIKPEYGPLDTEPYAYSRTQVTLTWDRKLLKDVEGDALFELIEAANYLNIKKLATLGCKKAGEQIKAKSADEVREVWNIRCDLTHEEELRLSENNPFDWEMGGMG